MEEWLKGLGIAGFFFFLVKGLLWLLIPYLISKGIIKRRRRRKDEGKS